MSLRPIDTDVLEDICNSIARENYGFIYVTDDKNEVKAAYEQANTGRLNASTLSISDIRKGLSEIAGNELTDFEQIRDGVFYCDQFGAVGNEEITDELTMLFSQKLVVTGERLRSAFSLAIDDLEFFVDELESRDYLRRIRAGQNDYYTIGTKLKERAGADEVGLDSQLAHDAVAGRISHSKLEDAIDVSATTDVIRYLENQDLIVDLDGEYLVMSLLDEYAQHLAGEIEETVEAELETAKYVLQRGEYDEVIKNGIRSHSDILSHARSIETELLDEVEAAVADRLGVELDRDIVVQTDEFDQHTTAEARRIHADVKSELDVEPGKLGEWVTAAEDHFEEIRVSNTPAVNDHIQSVIKERYREVVNEEEFGGMGL